MPTYNTVSISGTNLFHNSSGEGVNVTLTPLSMFFDTPNNIQLNPQVVTATSDVTGAWTISNILDPTPDGSGLAWNLNVKDSHTGQVLYNQNVQIAHNKGATQNWLTLTTPPAPAATAALMAQPSSNGIPGAGLIPVADGSGNSSWGYTIGWYHVKNFGAKGDGITDDTTAIQNAVNAASAAGGGTVYLPQGKYLVSGAGITISTGVSLRGDNDFVAWFYPGTHGTRIVCSSAMANPLVNIAQGSSYWAIEGIAFSTTSGNTTAPCIQSNGIAGAGNTCGSAIIRNVEAGNVGGIYLNYTNRIRLENIVLQSWYGNYGFYFNNCTIIYMEWTTSAPAVVGTSASGPSAAHYYLLNSGSLTMLNCGGAGTPYYGMDLNSATSLSLFDYENNGATQAVYHITGTGGDLHFHRIYNNGAACVNGVQIDGACSLGSIHFLGGSLGSFTGSAVSVNPSSGTVARCSFRDVYMSVSQNNPYFSFAGSTWGWDISRCTFLGTQVSPVVFTDASTQAQRRMIFANNICELTQGPPTFSITGSLLSGYGWQVHDNFGLNPLGKIASPPAVGASGAAVVNNTSAYCDVYVTAPAGVTVSAIAVGASGNATGITVQPGSTSPPVRVPPNTPIYLTYSGGTPTWAWFGD